MQIGSFKLGGVDWSIEIDNSFCKNNSMAYNSSLQKIRISDIYEGEKLCYDKMKRNIWDAIISSIILDHMSYKELNKAKILVPYTSLFYQALKTLTSTPGEWDGSVQIGGSDYIIVVDNKRMDRIGLYGEQDGNSATISLATKSDDEDYTEDFIYQTLLHEIAHAIAYELGRSKSKLNSERFVNTIATFIHEVWKTIEINFPDESD